MEDEVTLDGLVDTPGAGEEPESAPSEQAEAPQAEPAWTPPNSQEEYEQAIAQAKAEALSEAYGVTDGDPFFGFGQEEPAAEQQQPQAQPQPEAPAAQDLQLPEWVDPETAEALKSYAQQYVDERLGQIEPLVSYVAEAQGRQLNDQFLTTLQGQIGEFDKDTASAIATGFIEAGASPEQALVKAAQMTHAREQELLRKGAEEYERRMQRVTDAPSEPGVTGAASEPPPDPRTRSWDEIGEDWLKSQSPVTNAAG